MDWKQNWEVVGTRKANGGQASVRKVKRRGTEEYGAVKEMHDRHQRNQQRRQRLAREVEALSLAAGPGVPQVLEANPQDVDDVRTPLYIVQGWAEGRKLSDATGNQPISLDRALSIVRQLADILERVHSLGVIHRDIKPANIILGPNDVVHLVDFGIAWIDVEEVGDDPEFITMIGEELGNRFLRLADLAPGPVKNDRRTDLTFVVGILFYLLTGEPPVMLRNAQNLPPHEALAHTFPDALKADARWVPLLRFFAVGFEPAIDFRYQSAADLKVGLDRITPPTSTPSDLEDTLATFREFMSQESIRARVTIQRELVSITHDMEAFFRDQANAADLQPVLQAGGASLTGTLAVSGEFSTFVKGMATPSVRVEYEIAPDFAQPAWIVAKYSLNSQGKVYYKGPAIDTQSLRDAVERQQEIIFRDMVRILMMKIANSGLSLTQVAD